MTSKFASAAACALVVGAGVAFAGSSVGADPGPGETCTITQSVTELKVDPYILDNPGSPDPSLIQPSEFLLGVTNSFTTPPNVRLTASVGGKEYGPVIIGSADPTEAFGSIDPPTTLPSLFMLEVLQEVLSEIYEAGTTDLDEDYTIDELEAAFYGPALYPASFLLEYVNGESEAVCALGFDFEDAGARTKPCSGRFGYLCDYLDRFESESATLPDTL